MISIYNSKYNIKLSGLNLSTETEIDGFVLFFTLNTMQI